MLHVGFCASAVDGNLFILRHQSFIVHLLLYVDDIIITGNSSAFVSSIIKLLGIDFDLKDFGLLHYFLGLQIDYTSTGLFVHQTKYATDLLQNFGMTNASLVKHHAHLIIISFLMIVLSYLILRPIEAWLGLCNILLSPD